MGFDAHTVTTTVSVAVITVASRRGGYMDLFEETALRNGIKPVILGLGVEYPANVKKLPLMLDWAEKNSHISHVIFSDAYDSFFIEGTSEIMARFKQFGHPFVCTGDSCCWPDYSIRNIYPKGSNTDVHYLNSGGFVAEMGAFVSVLKDSIALIPKFLGGKKDRSDQRLWQMLHIANNDRFRIDYNCSIFMCMPSFSDSFELTEVGGKKTLINTVTNKSPCVVHCAGQTKIDQIAQFLA